MENLNASSETMFKINNQIVCKNKKRPSFYTLIETRFINNSI